MEHHLNNFELLFKKFRPGLKNFANSIIHNEPEAEEIVNDVFLSIWDKRGTLSFDDNLKNYLFKAVKNRCLNAIKRNKLPFQEMDETLPVIANQSNALDRMEANEVQKSITFHINRLPNKCKQVFLLSRMQELSYKEIAELMDISPKTVENQIGIALKFLKESLTPSVK